MRSIWKGSISFGLVYIPVRLYAATEDRSIRFNLLHERCGTRIRYKRWCDTCDAEVDETELVRAYRWAPAEYVVVREEDLENLPLVTAKTVEIRDFVQLDDVDPILFDRTYFLEPVDGGAKAYGLLREAMRRTNRVALAKVALRARESLACVRVYEGAVLTLQTMHYPDEIRSYSALEGIDASTTAGEQELQMAVELIDRLTSPFEPERYEDEYRRALLARIEEKARGRQITAPPPGVKEPRVVDLMEALRASLARADQERDSPEPAKGR